MSTDSKSMSADEVRELVERVNALAEYLDGRVESAHQTITAAAACILALQERAEQAERERDEACEENAICRDAIEAAAHLVTKYVLMDEESDDMAIGAARATLRMLNESIGKAVPRLFREKPEGQKLYGLAWRERTDRLAAAEQRIGELEYVLDLHLTTRGGLRAHIGWCPHPKAPCTCGYALLSTPDSPSPERPQ